MIKEDKTSKFTMSDFYKVLEYLPRARVDRQVPVDFKKDIFVDGESIVLPLVYPEFEGIDFVEVFVNCHGVSVDVSNVVLSLANCLMEMQVWCLYLQRMKVLMQIMRTLFYFR